MQTAVPCTSPCLPLAHRAPACSAASAAHWKCLAPGSPLQPLMPLLCWSCGTTGRGCGTCLRVPRTTTRVGNPCDLWLCCPLYCPAVLLRCSRARARVFVAGGAFQRSFPCCYGMCAGQGGCSCPGLVSVVQVWIRDGVAAVLHGCIATLSLACTLAFGASTSSPRGPRSVCLQASSPATGIQRMCPSLCASWHSRDY